MNIRALSLVFITVSLCIISLSSGRAASGTWTADSDGLWSDTTKWGAGTVADGAGETATLTANFTLPRVITLDTPRTIGRMFYNDTGGNPDVSSLTVTGTNVLTLANITGQVPIYANGTNQFIVDVVLAGTDGAAFGAGSDNNNSLVVLNKPAIFTDETPEGVAGYTARVQRGRLVLGVDDALPPSTVLEFNSGNTGVLVLNGHNQELAGIVREGGDGTRQVWDTLGGTLVLNTPADKSYNFPGQVGNAANGANLNLVKRGAGTQRLSNGSNPYTGTTVIEEGVLELAGALGDISMGTYVTNVGTLGLLANSAEPLVLRGTGFNGLGAVAVLSGSRTLSGPITLEGDTTIGVDLGALVLSGTLDGAGTLTFVGTNTLTFSGFHSHSGATFFNVAGLSVPASLTLGPGGGVVADGTTISIAPGAQLVSPSLSIGTAGEISIHVDYGSLSGSNPGQPAISDSLGTGTALTAGASSIVLNFSGSGFVQGQFPVIKYAGSIGGKGFAPFALGTLPPGVIAQLVHNTAGASIDLKITLVVNSLAWYGNVDGNWDINGTMNWRDPLSAAAAYKEYGTTDVTGDSVTFDDTLLNDMVTPPRTNISLTTTLRPATINVTSQSMPYTLAGPGKVSGPARLEVGGAGSLTIDTVNDFSGGTTMQSGLQTLLLGNDAALGSGPVILNGGTISAAGSMARKVTNSLAITAASFGASPSSGTLTFSGPLDYRGAGRVLTLNSEVVFSGMILGGGLARKAGPGTLTYNGVTGRETAGDWQVEDGQLIFSGGDLEKSVGGIRVMATTPGGLALYVQNGGTVTMSGTSQNIRIGSGSPPGDPSATNIVNLAGVLTWTPANVNSQVQMGSNCALAQLNLLAGGLLRVGSFAPQGADNMEVNFDGGTLVPLTSRVNFMQGLTRANMLNGGLTVDTEGFDITIAQALLAGGTGGLTKNGAGGLTLTGTNTYTGPTIVTAGQLVLGAAGKASGPITVSEGAELVFWSDGPSVTLDINSALFSAGSSLRARFTGSSGNPAQPAAHIANLTVNGTVSISAALAGISPGVVPVVRYDTLSGAGSFAIGELPQGTLASLSTNTATKTIELVITTVNPLLWTGLESQNWDIGASTNWALLDSPKKYLDGDNVLFDDTAKTATVVVAEPVSPGSVVFSNTTASYTLTATSAGRLTGATGILKDGSAEAYISTGHDFLGDVVVRNGILSIGNASALGSIAGATYVSNGATLNIKNTRLTTRLEPIYIAGAGYAGLGAFYSDAGTGNADYFRDLRLTADASVGAAAAARFGFNSTNGTITSVGGLHKLTKVGAGQFDFQEATITVGEIDVREGILQAANSTLINPDPGITVQEGAEFRIYRLATPMNRPFILNGGRINVTGSNADTQNQIGGEITLNGSGILEVGGGFFMVATNTVRGAGDLIKAGAGLVTLGGVNTYTGNTVVQNGTMALAAGGSITLSPNILLDATGTLDVSLAAPWSLSSSQTLAGSGAVTGNAIVNGTLSPGPVIGALTFSHDLTLAGTTVIEVTADGGLTNDLVNALGNLTFGGVLKIMVSGTTPLSVGDTFSVFNFASPPAGSFSQIMLPVDYTWDVTQLPVDGSVRVTGASAVRPTLAVVRAGNALQFTWTGPYKLQAQTNTITTGLSTNWFDYPGGASTGVTVPMSATDATVFFRLISL